MSSSVVDDSASDTSRGGSCSILCSFRYSLRKLRDMVLNVWFWALEGWNGLKSKVDEKRMLVLLLLSRNESALMMEALVQ